MRESKVSFFLVPLCVNLVILFFFDQMMVNCYFLFLCFPLCFCLVDHGQPSKVRFRSGPRLTIQLQPSFTNVLLNRSIGVDRDVTFTCAVKNLGRYKVRSANLELRSLVFVCFQDKVYVHVEMLIHHV